MKKSQLIFILLICFIITACNNEEQIDQEQDEEMNIEETIDEKTDEDQIMEEFDLLLESNASIAQVIEFIDEEIENISAEYATEMILDLEQLHFEQLPIYEEKFHAESIQEQFVNFYIESIEAGQTLEEVAQGKVLELIEEAAANGFKVETVEGFFFPIIDYEQYAKYSPYIENSVADYLEIMATESNESSAKDGGIVIDWHELVKRANRMEAFIEAYPDSEKFEQVSDLYSYYIAIITNGMTNTPLFNYDNKTMNEAAQTEYNEIINESAATKTEKIVAELLELAEKNDYVLNDEIKAFQDSYQLEIEL